MARFKTRARAVDMLGRQQIADVATAISELFKNAHDAYAEHVEVDNFRSDDLFVVRDDGIGMTAEEFENRWLVLGTESKVDSDSHTHAFKPHPLFKPNPSFKFTHPSKTNPITPLIKTHSPQTTHSFQFARAMGMISLILSTLMAILVSIALFIESMKRGYLFFQGITMYFIVIVIILEFVSILVMFIRFVNGLIPLYIKNPKLTTNQILSGRFGLWALQGADELPYVSGW